MKFYMAYGSNMNMEQMEKRCPDAEYLGVAELDGYSLQFRGEGHANIVKREGSKIPVLIWKISKQCEETLDIYEDYPSYYIKKTMDIELDGENLETMVYVMTDEKASILAEPSREYYEIILEAYKYSKLDTNILEKALEENRLENKI